MILRSCQCHIKQVAHLIFICLCSEQIRCQVGCQNILSDALCFFFAFSHDLRHKISHLFGCTFLHLPRDVGIGSQREARVEVTEHTRHRFCVYAILKRQGYKCVPLRYNYAKPEKLRISRVFGYLARFFILFQTEKSSREVVISQGVLQ